MAHGSKNNEYLKLLVVILVLFAIVSGFLIYVSIPLLSSTSVVLATQPVDPFDLVRGQYITIRYEIGNFWIENSYDAGLSSETLKEFIEEDKDKFLKDVARNLLTAEESEVIITLP